MTATEIIEQYEVPRELEDVIYLAYSAGKVDGMEEMIAIDEKFAVELA